jgi:hypothetical protein
MEPDRNRSNLFARRTLSVLIVGMLPMFIISIIPQSFSGFSLNNSDIGISSLKYPEISNLLNNYIRYFAPLFGVIAFISICKSVKLKDKFESTGELYFNFLKYALFVILIYFIFYFCHLELTKSNLLIRGMTNNIVGFLFFYIAIIFPALVFSLQVLLIYLQLVIKKSL